LTPQFTPIDRSPLNPQPYDPLLHPALFYSEAPGMLGSPLQSESSNRTPVAAQTQTSTGDTGIIHQIRGLFSQLCPTVSNERISRFIEELQAEERRPTMNSSDVERRDDSSNAIPGLPAQMSAGLIVSSEDHLNQRSPAMGSHDTENVILTSPSNEFEGPDEFLAYLASFQSS